LISAPGTTEMKRPSRVYLSYTDGPPEGLSRDIAHLIICSVFNGFRKILHVPRTRGILLALDKQYNP
jgi:hypothetical protein